MQSLTVLSSSTTDYSQAVLAAVALMLSILPPVRPVGRPIFNNQRQVGFVLPALSNRLSYYVVLVDIL